MRRYARARLLRAPGASNGSRRQNLAPTHLPGPIHRIEGRAIFCEFVGRGFIRGRLVADSPRGGATDRRTLGSATRERADRMGRTGRTERRKKVIVLREAQKRIILAVSLFPALSLAMATMLIAVFCRKLLGEATRTDVDLPSLVPLFLSVLGLALVSCLIILNQALRFSNRISGPAYRVVKTLECAGLNPRRRENRVYFDDPDGLTVQIAGPRSSRPG